MRNIIVSSCIVTILSLASTNPVFAAPPPKTIAVCGLADISPGAVACSGFYAGNLLSNSAADIAAQTTGLSALGFAWDGNFGTIEKIASLGGSHTVDFASLLNGISYVGFHFGGGKGGPGNATAFYKLDAGVDLDTLHLNYNASSGAVLYSTGEAPVINPGSTVPEPASWLLMIAGFGLVGAMLRRTSTIVVAA